MTAGDQLLVTIGNKCQSIEGRLLFIEEPPRSNERFFEGGGEPGGASDIGIRGRGLGAAAILRCICCNSVHRLPPSRGILTVLASLRMWLRRSSNVRLEPKIYNINNDTFYIL